MSHDQSLLYQQPGVYPGTPDNPAYPITQFRLAYIAHNAPTWAEFVVNVPAFVAEGVSVNHYSQPVRVEGKNVMFELT